MGIEKKKIKVLGRGLVCTSRGMIPGPISTPYMESIDNIRIMITKFNNHVVEVLNDGSEIDLTILNFNKDNNKKEEVINKVEVRKTEEPKEITPTQPMNKHMSNKEKKKLEQEKRRAEEAAKAAESSKEQGTPVTQDETPATEPVSDVIPE